MIFDYDGLIVDSERVIADTFIAVMAELGAAVALEEIGHLFGSTEDDHLWDAFIAARCDTHSAEIEARMTPLIRAGYADLPLLPGVRELVDLATERGVALGLGTGQDRERLEPALERLGLRFDVVVTAAEVARGKPNPDIFLEVARQLGVDPAECLVLEDSLAGCQAATAAGMRVIACPSTVTAHCTFPEGVTRVASLLDVDLRASMQ